MLLSLISSKFTAMSSVPGSFAINNGYSNKKAELYRAMEIDYRTYVQIQNPTEMLKFIHLSLEEFPKSINVQRAAQDYKYRQGLIVEKEILGEEDY